MSLGDILKGWFKNAAQDILEIDPILARAVEESAGEQYWSSINVSQFPVFKEVILQLSHREKAALILKYIKDAHQWHEANHNIYNQATGRKAYVCQGIVEQLFRTKLDLTDDEIVSVIDSFIAHKQYLFKNVLGWPVKNLVKLAQGKYKGQTVAPHVIEGFNRLKQELSSNQNYYYEKQSLKLIEQIDTLLFTTDGVESVKPVFFLGDDAFAVFANPTINNLPDDIKPHWYALMMLCQRSGGSTPSKKFLTDGSALINKIGSEVFIPTVTNWFNFLISTKERVNNTDYLTSYEFLTPVNTEALKGFVWLCATLPNPMLYHVVASLANRAYRKIPGIGQACTALGNAAVFTLYKAGLEGVSHLSRLKLKVKQANTQTLITKYINAIAQEQGVSADTLEDMAVDDFNLTTGKVIWVFDDYQAVLTVEKVGKVNLTWLKKDDSVQKTDPASVKENHADELKQFKTIGKNIEQALITQRDRLDRSYRTGREMTWVHFNTYYHGHQLVSIISRQLIWRFKNANDVIDAIWLKDSWTTLNGKVFTPGDEHTVLLWHPALSSTENVLQWRDLLIANELQQPLKQAFREIYLLTEAEINTRTYSNRMAGHILKQHQFNSLAKSRDWRYMLQGAFDGGSDGAAALQLPGYNLIAEYWPNGVEEINNIGIFNYVATDQIRFRSTTSRDAIELIQIPVVVFSEVMRDVDLFVGVASVGNDPNWRDNGGLPAYRDYWQSYAFGDLNETSKGRKEILTRLLPRLRIAKVSEIRDKFLVVQGKRRTYKIHLGSTNILMEPNDQYLCIVPDRSQKSYTENVFLPFEGDNGLSVIISKAMLLADDDKITDSTILSQINRR